MIYCPSCDEEMTEWHMDIYECKECDVMIDAEELK